MRAMMMFAELARSRPVYCAVWALAIAACGDDFSAPLDGPPLAPAGALFVSAHFDDDLIFMQPELIAALNAGPVTTVYAMSGDPVYGLGRADRNFDFGQRAYASVVGSSDWDCGYTLVAGSPAHHCRLRDRPVSLIRLDIPDGGREGMYDTSPLNLIEGRITEVPILGWAGGTATKDSIIDSFAELISVTKPDDIHALDLGGLHGYDHSSHLFAAAFTFWGAARVGYTGTFHWHRGYNVGDSPISFDGAAPDYEAARTMLGVFDACYFGCGPCGTSCVVEAHDIWLQRQYGSPRTPLAATGALALEGDPALCLSAIGGRVVLAGCSGAAPVQLEATGQLIVGGACVASAPDPAAPVVLEPCSSSPAQYWVSDGDGHLWNGSPPPAATDMANDHVRCLSAEPVAGAAVGAPICGARLSPVWQLAPS